MTARLSAARQYLGLNRNVGVLGVSIFGLGLGEEMWQSFMPLYLSALGANSRIIGLFGSCKDLLDSVYQYPGGWINDRFGRKRALTVFTVSAMAGYAVFAAAFHWSISFIALALAMAWKSGAFPTTFAVIGESLPKGKRAIAFSVQSILVRLPRVIGAPLGGLLIGAFGAIRGVRFSLAITLVLALIVLATQRFGYREKAGKREYTGKPIRQVFAEMDSSLKVLLLSDCLVRIGEGVAAVFIVLYVTKVLGFHAATYGLLYAIQQTIAILLYLPMGKVADATGRRPMVALTFLFFALFPLAVRLSHSIAALVIAFIFGGLKEMGEPARKSLIVDLSDEAQRGRAVGVYYSIRNMLVVPAGAIGGLLWRISPRLTLEVASGIGIVGVLVYLFTTKGAVYEMGHA